MIVIYDRITIDYWFLRNNGYSHEGAMDAINITYVDVSYTAVVGELALYPF